MNAGKDVGSGSDGSSEGGEEWLHSGYNVIQLDLLIWIIRERHQDNYMVGLSNQKDWVAINWGRKYYGNNRFKKNQCDMSLFFFHLFIPSICQIVNE